jgi:hypothetical protein
MNLYDLSSRYLNRHHNIAAQYMQAINNPKRVALFNIYHNILFHPKEPTLLNEEAADLGN